MMTIQLVEGGKAADGESYTKKKCPYCIMDGEPYTSFETNRILHSPNILVIQLKRTKFINNKLVFDSAAINYEQFITLTEGDTNVSYELIGLITYKGNGLCGHYLAYILNPKNEWWLLDDLPAGIGKPTICL